MRYTLEIIVFISGAAVMIVEIVGSRILAAFLGTSVIVWTSLIGIILASLSLGYYLGGIIADGKGANFKSLSYILLLSSFSIFLTAVIYKPILAQISKMPFTFWLKTLLSTVILFTPTSFFLGVITPYSIKLKLKSIKKSASAAGNIYALSTLGSITGTFLTGFILFKHLGITNILLVNSFLLVLLSIISYNKHIIGKIIILVLIIQTSLIIKNINKGNHFEYDTDYQTVTIKEQGDISGKNRIRILKTGNFLQSAINLDKEELVFSYINFFNLINHFTPNINKILVLGGGGYVFPQYYQKHNPSVRVTVVELDPGITEIAKNHFFLDKNHHLNIVHQDARIFLNENTEKFDSVIIDVFKGSSEIPFQIATIEAVDKIYKALNPEGTVIINFVSAIQDNNGKIARALYSTYREKFPQVYLFPLNRINYQNIGNVELVALKSSKLASFSSNNPIYKKFLDNLYSKDIITDVPVLTDDFAPLEHYMMAAVN